MKKKESRKLSLEKHIEEIQKSLDLKSLPRFVYGEKDILDHCKKQSIITPYQIQKLEKNVPNGLFLWIDDYTVCIKRPTCSRIGTVAHELRHAYQYCHRPEIFPSDGYPVYPGKRSIKNFLGDLAYVYSSKEWDANCFAMKYCFKQGLYKEAVRYLIRLSMPVLLPILICIFCIIYFRIWH